MAKSKNLFGICCGDFGCHQSGVGIPAILHDKEKTSALLELARDKGDFGKVALHSLKISVAGLRDATCSCDLPAMEDMESVMKIQKGIFADLKQADKSQG